MTETSALRKLFEKVTGKMPKSKNNTPTSLISELSDEYSVPDSPDMGEYVKKTDLDDYYTKRWAQPRIYKTETGPIRFSARTRDYFGDICFYNQHLYVLINVDLNPFNTGPRYFYSWEREPALFIDLGITTPPNTETLPLSGVENTYGVQSYFNGDVLITSSGIYKLNSSFWQTASDIKYTWVELEFYKESV